MSHFHSEECLCDTVGYGACDIPRKRRSVTGKSEIPPHFPEMTDRFVSVILSEAKNLPHFESAMLYSSACAAEPEMV